MKCPHCLKEFHSDPTHVHLGSDHLGRWGAGYENCPACSKLILTLEKHTSHVRELDVFNGAYVQEAKFILPKSANRPPPALEVPADFAEDYLEACLVINDSPQASAALSRRCLQHILRECSKVKHSDLAREIQEVLDSEKLPSHISEALDAIRNIGNLAAHPIKSQSVGAIYKVEPGEAEWSLDVLESLFDFYFVQPAILKRKKDALNAKLVDAGKPQMKAVTAVNSSSSAAAMLTTN